MLKILAIFFTCLFATLKLAGVGVVATWSWLAVFTPLIIYVVLLVLLVVGSFGLLVKFNK